jgi:protein-S-isoprenylcysteine O-methyltransferase Ste14
MNVIKKLLYTILSISGFVPDRMTVARWIFMVGSLLFTILVLPKYLNLNFAMGYFAISTIVYLGFIFWVLPQHGFRIKLMERFGEEDAYAYYEGFLAFAFFHNGASLTFISQSSAGSGFWSDVPQLIIVLIAGVLFVTGLVVKIWSAYLVGVPVYYWKDMFLGRKVSDFVASGPYKYLNNPMYGVGQLQVYAMAIYYNSVYGLLFAVINQLLVFLFYFTVEKAFIYRTYIAPQKNPPQP